MTLETDSLAPSYVVFQVGRRRVAVARECVAELIASPVLFTFPHTTPLVTGVALRRGRIVPILDLGPGLLGAPSPDARFFLVIERHLPGVSERCAIPVQGECELVTGTMLPGSTHDDFVIGALDLNGTPIEVVDLEKAIATSARIEQGPVPAMEALP
jgi:chemotaxis signal transduction protein